jgi:hypothetical protein
MPLEIRDRSAKIDNDYLADAMPTKQLSGCLTCLETFLASRMDNFSTPNAYS